ncbi:GntR family transcriptional regulator [Flammeovirga yaeyamensis]|uniref:GntR family transcriptional regulator n=1 Tax=Flammeovirga yaeyamensis TaxID=367791 RepID=A0AAX1N3B8_9BACT|nr:GntR family transcriptional regulator [Flammeovirga yaeyamensis]MBB3700609.1 DNA-binding transcriptional regulator YhcF (GntR family) [Flammeovirga yaeyamensis]NMF37725.1 GntR family transcriptional regulator [Flammeovirga yaeyamensis]QWG02034.1 GntR family transcriptional regulator [Flammeovirga yaeyamensis]
MEFKNTKSIFTQIGDDVKDKIMEGEYAEEGKIPSTRELAGIVGVNPNTTIKAYAVLQQEGIIYTQRGKGYFVSQGAKATIVKNKQAEFLNEVLPETVDHALKLGITFDELQNYLKDLYHEKK